MLKILFTNNTVILLILEGRYFHLRQEFITLTLLTFGMRLILCYRGCMVQCFRLGYTWPLPKDASVTKSKFLLVTAQQTNKSKGEVLGQGIVASFRKPENWRWQTSVPKKNHLICVRIQAYFILKGEVVGLVGVDSLMPECWHVFQLST